MWQILDDFCTLLQQLMLFMQSAIICLQLCSLIYVSLKRRLKNMFCLFFVSTFNPADYTEPAQTEESYTSGSTWSNTGNLEQEDANRE